MHKKQKNESTPDSVILEESSTSSSEYRKLRKKQIITKTYHLESSEESTGSKKISHSKKTIIVPMKYELFPEEDFMKNCPNYDYIPTVLPKVPRIIVIGDVHGDLQLAIRSFKIAKLVDEQLNWIADPPNSVVVQVGDQVDSCRPIKGVYDCHEKKQKGDAAEDMSVMDFFNKMHDKAKVK